MDMFHRITFYDDAPEAVTSALSLIGSALIGFGLLVFFVPRVLVAIVSGVLVLAGCGFLALAWKSRQAWNGFRFRHDDF